MKSVVQTLIGLGILLIYCSQTAVGWRSFKVIFSSFTFQANGDLIDIKLQITNDTGETALNVHVNFLDDVDDISLRYAIALEANEGNYTALVNRSVNFCKFLKQRSTDPILKLIYEDLLKQNTFIKMCPIKKGAYYIHDYRIDEEMLPSYVPETSFFVSLQMDLANGGRLFKGRINGRIDKSKGFNNLKMFSLG